MIHYFFSIGSLKNVTTLKIDENQLMYLPDSIGGWVVCECVDKESAVINSACVSACILDIYIKTIKADSTNIQNK